MKRLDRLLNKNGAQLFLYPHIMQKDNAILGLLQYPQAAKIDKLLDFGFVDTFRKFNKEGGNYTWWPYAYDARKRNLGWRIDYCFTSKKLTPKVKGAFILKNIPCSDHCPIGINFPGSSTTCDPSV